MNHPDEMRLKPRFNIFLIVIFVLLHAGCGSSDSFSDSGPWQGYPQAVATDLSGNVYVADTLHASILKISQSGVVTTFVGSAANFYLPQSIATDSSGNVYVAESCAIRKITPAGVVTTLAGTNGSGSTDGIGSTARFNVPQGIATDAAGNVYVADTNNNTIRMITPAGVVSTLAGTAGLTGSTDGTGAAARFSHPEGIATDASGNVYVSDSWSTIRKITPAGVVTTLAGTAVVIGSTDGTGAAASFNNLRGIATDSAGNVYVADSGNAIIRKVTPTGVVTTLAGTAGVHGNTDGLGTAASFAYPQGPQDVATDTSGNVYVADSNNHSIRKITPAGLVTTFAVLPATY